MRRTALVVAVLLCSAPPVVGSVEAESRDGRADAIFRFVGGDFAPPEYPVHTYSEVEIGGDLMFEVNGMQVYAVVSVDIVMDVRYFFYRSPHCPIGESCRVSLDTSDFELVPGTSLILLNPEGAPNNPYPTDMYSIVVGELVHPKAWTTPMGTQVVFEAGTGLAVGTADIPEDNYPESAGAFGGTLNLPHPYDDWYGTSWDFGYTYMQDTPTAVRYLDADLPDRSVAGAAADGASQMIVEVRGADSQPDVVIPQNGGAWVEGSSWAQPMPGVWRRTWQAPRDFDTTGQYQGAGFREIDFGFTIGGQSVDGPPFHLHRPPVVLLHGIFSDAGAWDTMAPVLAAEYLGGNANLVHAEGYPCAAHFEDNVDNVRDIVRDALNKAREQGWPNDSDQIVAKRVDIVAHSMGGILANMYVADAIYQQDVNRIITIETPHCGSEFANYALYFVDEMPPEVRRFFFNDPVNWLLFKLFRLSLKGGAAEDLQVGSQAMSNYRTNIPAVPVRAVVCSHRPVGGPSRMLDLVYDGRFTCGFTGGRLGGLWLWDATLDQSSTWFEGAVGHLWQWFPAYTPAKVEAGLFSTVGGSSDYVVSSLSQRGGLFGQYVTSREVIDHTTATADDGVIEAVRTLLESSVSTFAPGFAPPGDYPAVPESIGVVDPDEWVSESVVARGVTDRPSASERPRSYLTITYPEEGATFAPGESLTVEVAYEGQPDYGVAFFAESGAFGLDDAEPWTFGFVIDEEYIGPMYIGAGALDEDAAPGDSTSHRILVNVLPTDTPIEVVVAPTGPLFLYAGEERQLHVSGRYDDGVTRNVTPGAVGTIYTSSNPAVASVGEDGNITALSPGETWIGADNGAESGLYVIVPGTPSVPVAPYPADGGTGVSPSTSMDWAASERVSSYDLYLWKCSQSQPGTPTAPDLNESFYNPPSDLDGGTEYCWRVVARNDVGETTGALWSFTTSGAGPDGEGGGQIDVSPNPFVPSRGQTEISFFGDGLPHARIEVYNKAGEHVASIRETEGETRLDWGAVSAEDEPLASGVYIWVARLESGRTVSGKFAIIK